MKKFLIIFCLLNHIFLYAQKIKYIETEGDKINYDSLGQPTKVISNHYGRTNTYNFKNKYDKQNRLIYSEAFIDSFPLYKTCNKYEGSKLIRIDSYRSTKFGTVHKYTLLEYNSNDSISRKTEFSGRNDTLEIIFNTYDKENRLVLQNTINFEYKNRIHKTYSYTFNSKMEKEYRIELQSRDTTDFKETKEYFNNDGETIKTEIWEQHASVLHIDDQEFEVSKEELRNGKKGYLKITEFDYKYDKYNNWIQKDYYFFLGNGTDKVKKTTERAITYYQQ